MGLLFQPRRPGPAARPRRHLSVERGARDPELVFLAALEAVVVGDASRFDELFTDDVTVSCPQMAAESRAEVQAMLGSPESSLSDVDVGLVHVMRDGDRVAAEWRLHATFSRPVLFEDNLLIEPTGATVHMYGASFADFRGSRIWRFRSYFDDSQLLTDVPYVSPDVRMLGHATPRDH
jgi:ketosteroid isomerase-like protein